MYEIKEFKTQEAMENFITKNEGKIEWEEVFIENKYAIEYRRLRLIEM